MQVRRQTLSFLIVNIALQRWAPLEKHKTGRKLKLQAILKSQTGKVPSATPFLCFLSLSCVFCCFLAWYWPLVLTAHERPRNEYNRPVEPRTFAAFQLPLKPPYVSLCLTFLDDTCLRFFKSNFAAVDAVEPRHMFCLQAWYTNTTRHVDFHVFIVLLFFLSVWLIQILPWPFDFPYGLLTLSCRYSARAYCSQS